MGAEVGLELLFLELVLTLLLIVGTLRHIYAVGRTGSDHFVATVVAACMTWYAVLFVGAPRPVQFGIVAAQVTQWGLFFTVHRRGPCPRWMWYVLALPSQAAYAFALWGGLVWMVRAPLVYLAGGAWRDILWPGAWLLPALGLTLVGFVDAQAVGRRLRIFPIKGLPIRIVHLSDIHVSATLHRQELDPIIASVNAQKPDLVLVTGDLVTPFSEHSHEQLEDAIKRVKAPVYLCPGNHDLPVLASLAQDLSSCGAQMLINQSVTVAFGGGQIELVGLSYGCLAKEEEQKALEPPAGATQDRYRILLVHNPEQANRLPEGRFDLILSGHTHGGLVGGTVLGVNVSLYRLMGYRDQGWWKTGGAAQYVHRGNWLFGVPPRMGVAGEVVVLEPD